MLINAVWLYMKLHGTAVERDADDFRTQADGRLKIDGNSVSGTFRNLYLELDAFEILGIAQIQFGRTDRHVPHGKRGPIGGNVWCKGERSCSHVGLQTKQAT